MTVKKCVLQEEQSRPLQSETSKQKHGSNESTSAVGKKKNKKGKWMRRQQRRLLC